MHGFDDYLTKDQAAEVLNVKPSILDSWRWHGKGPAYVRFGKVVRYSRAAIQQFIAANVYTAIKDRMSTRIPDGPSSRNVLRAAKETAEERRSRLRSQREMMDGIRRSLQLRWDQEAKEKRERKTLRASTPLAD